MRRAIYTIVCLICIGYANAQQIREANPTLFPISEGYHFGYVSVSAGYTSLHTRIPNAAAKGNIGGAASIGYEYRNNGLWVSAGGGMSLVRSSLRVGNEVFDFYGMDTQGKATTFHYAVQQQDQMEWISLDVPVMAGYYWKGLHAGVGVKMQYFLHPSTHTTGTYSLSATNADYDVTFENMPEYGYTTYEVTQDEANETNIGVSLTGEIGYDILSQVFSHSRICQLVTVSFYFEYGLNNILKANPAPKDRLELLSPTTDATKATLHPTVNTYPAPARTVPYFTGIKITYSLGGNPQTRSGDLHKGCGCYDK